MGVEIERKFIVNERFSKSILSKKGELIWQAYLLSNENRSIRIRKKGEGAFITLKSGKDLLKRKEFEYEIPIKDFEELKIVFNDFPFIEKTRYLFNYKGIVWEVDIFSGANIGLIIAEIELESREQKFKKPEWIGEEVTNNPNYLNSNLANTPYSTWEKV